MKTITQLKESDAQRFLDRFGVAITKGDSKAISQCFELPMVYVSDEGVMPFTSSKELEGMFAQGHKFYTDKGLVDTKPEIDSFTKLSDRLYETYVRWPGFDEAGKEKWEETSMYVLRLDENGAPRICVAATLGGKDK